MYLDSFSEYICMHACMLQMHAIIFKKKRPHMLHGIRSITLP